MKELLISFNEITETLADRLSFQALDSFCEQLI